VTNGDFRGNRESAYRPVAIGAKQHDVNRLEGESFLDCQLKKVASSITKGTPLTSRILAV
jgi:hypothetical protein